MTIYRIGFSSTKDASQKGNPFRKHLEKNSSTPQNFDENSSSGISSLAINQIHYSPHQLQLLGEQVSKKRLWHFLNVSKTDERVSLAAANAISALVISGESFSGTDLSGVQISGAHLDGGIFYQTNLEGANLESCSLRGACLTQAQLNGANLRKVAFGELHSIIRPEHRISSMCLSKDKTKLIVKSSDRISICSLSEGREEISIMAPKQHHVFTGHDSARTGVWIGIGDVGISEEVLFIHTQMNLRIYQIKDGQKLSDFLYNSTLSPLFVEQGRFLIVHGAKRGDTQTIGGGRVSVIRFDGTFPSHNVIEKIDHSGKLLQTISLEDFPTNDKWLLIENHLNDNFLIFYSYGSTADVYRLDLEKGESSALFLMANLVWDYHALFTDHKLLVVFGMKQIHLFSTESLQLIATLPMRFPIVEATISPKGQFLLGKDIAGTGFLWDLKARKEILKLPPISTSLHPSLFFHEETLLLLAHKNGTLAVWDIEKQEKVKTLPGRRKVISDLILTDNNLMIFSYGPTVAREFLFLDQEDRNLRALTDDLSFALLLKNGKDFVTGTKDGILQAWKQEGRLTATFSGHEKEITALAATKELLFSSEEGGRLIVWDLFKQKEIKTLNLLRDIVALNILDQEHLLVTTKFGLLEIWNWHHGSQDQEIVLTDGLIDQSIFSTNHLIFTDVHDTVYFFSLISMTLIHQEKIGTITCLNVEGELLLVGTEEKVQVWDLVNQKLLRTIPQEGKIISSIALVNDTLAIGDTFGEVEIWKSECIERFRVCEGKVAWLKFGSQEQLFSIGKDKTVRSWNINGTFPILNWQSSSPLMATEANCTNLKELSIEQELLLEERGAHFVDEADCIKIIQKTAKEDLAKLRFSKQMPLENNPLTFAMRRNSINILIALKEAGIDLDRFFQEHPLHLAMSSKSALSYAHFRQLVELCDVEALNRFKETPFQLASRKGRYGFMKLLLQKQADPSHTSQNETSAVHEAARKGHLECLKLLAQTEIDVAQYNMNGESPILLAAKEKHFRCFQFLAERNPQNYTTDTRGLSMAHYAISNGLRWLKVLGKYGTNFNEVYAEEKATNLLKVQTQKKTAAHFAVESGNVEILQFLIEAGIDIDKVDNEGNTLGHYAALANSLPHLKFLAEKNPTLLSQANNSGATPLRLAAQKGHLESLQFLAGLGLSLQEVDKEGLTLIHDAAKENHLSCLKWLIDQGLSPSQESQYDGNAVHFAAANHAIETLRFLISLDLDLSRPDKMGRTPAYRAAFSGDSACLELLAEKGADLTTADHEGNGPIHVAILTGQMECVKILIREKANLSQCTRNNLTPTLVAMRRKNIECLRILYNAGADLLAPDSNGTTNVHIAAQLDLPDILELFAELSLPLSARNKLGASAVFSAISSNNLDCLRVLARLGCDLSLPNFDDTSPLHIAAFEGRTKCVELLIENGVPVSIPNCNGHTPAFFAAQMGHLEVLQLLAKAKADLRTMDLNGDTPLGIAARNGHGSCLQFLLEQNLDCLSENHNGSIPLLDAIREGHVKCVKLLITHPAPRQYPLKMKTRGAILATALNHLDILAVLAEEKFDFSKGNNEGLTPAHIAALEGHLEALRILVKYKAPLSSGDENGATPGFFAAQMGHLPILKLLAREKADLSKPESQGITPLAVAAYKGNTSCLEFLLKERLDCLSANKKGTTPLFLAIENGHVECVKLLLAQPKTDLFVTKAKNNPAHIAASLPNADILNLLRKKNFDFSKTNAKGETPAHFAAYHGNLFALQFFAKNKVPLLSRDKEGDTPAFLAAHNDHTPCLEFLIEQGANPSERNSHGVSLAHIAALNGSAHSLNYLITKGADIAAINTNGETPAFFAARRGHRDCLEKLIAAGADSVRPNNQGVNLADIANENGHADCVELLGHHNIFPHPEIQPIDQEGYLRYVEFMRERKVPGFADNVSEETNLEGFNRFINEMRAFACQGIIFPNDQEDPSLEATTQEWLREVDRQWMSPNVAQKIMASMMKNAIRM